MVNDFKSVSSVKDSIYREIDNRNYDKAKTLTDNFEKTASTDYDYHMLTCVWTDLGLLTKDIEMIRKAIVWGEHILNLWKDKPEKLGYQYYNLGNACYNLERILKLKKNNNVFFLISALDWAKYYYRLAIENLKEKASPEMYVNYGNLLNNIGRTLESFEQFNKALEIDDNHAMAMGNKGKALYCYSFFTPFKNHFLREAYYLLIKGSVHGYTIESKEHFDAIVKSIESQIDNIRSLMIEPLKYPNFRILKKMNFKNYFINFSYENKLFLNFCNYCQVCPISLKDNIMLPKLKNISKYKKLNSVYSILRTEFISARIILAQSQYSYSEFQSIAEYLGLTNKENSIQDEMIKYAFMAFYNILDKISTFLNEYLELNKSGTNFHKIWYSKSGKSIQKSIKNSNNRFLNSLFDFHKDLFWGDYRLLRKLRNAITHEPLKISEDEDTDLKNNIVKKIDLFNMTIDLARIVRSAIIYMLFFIYEEENKTEEKNENKCK